MSSLVNEDKNENRNDNMGACKCFGAVRRMSGRRITGLFLTLALALMFVLCPVGAAYAEEEFDSASDFDTTKYDVKMTVNKNASVYINEAISIDAHSAMHGIYRYIPFSRRIEYDSDGVSIHKAYDAMKISDISVTNEPYNTYRQRGNQVIQIGEAEKTFTGKKSYDLSYRVSLYEDDESKFDTFYYNVLPFDWETSIKKSKITLVMPKKFDKDDVTVMAGIDGNDAYSSMIKWKKKGNTITITSKETLPEECGITVGIKLPEGYFEDPATHTVFNMIMYVLGVLFIVIILFLWLRFGKDPKHIQTVEFYPPEGVTPAEVGYIIDGHIDKKDVVSLLFYFAQNGNLTITEEGKNDYIITKEQDLPPTAKTYERVFFSGLFEMGDEVRFSDLQESFYDTYMATKDMVDAEFDTRGRKIFHGTANVLRILMVLIPPVAAAFMGWMIWRTYGSILLLIASILIVLLAPASYIIGIYVQDRTHTLRKSKKLLLNLISFVLAIIAVAATIWIAVSVLGNWIIAILFAGVLGVGYFAARFMRCRTKRGAELLGKVLGFQEFIRVAEKDRLEQLVEEDPQYFYDVLPYAYVMGLSKKWAKKFEDIAVERPVWYRSYSGGYANGMFNTWMFYSTFNNFSRYANASVSVPPVDAGGAGGTRFGGGSGGGFSVGGGFGGGGGGGW